MSTIRLSHQSYEKYDCVEIPKNTKITPDIFSYLQKRVMIAKEKNKKILITLPGNANVSKRSIDEFIEFFQKHNDCIFIPQEALKWGKIWEKIVENDISSTDMDKAIAWLADQSYLTPKIIRREFGSVTYIKFSGHVAHASKHASKKIIECLKETKPLGRILEDADVYDNGAITTWMPVSGALILDIADAFMLNQKFLAAIAEGLQEYNLNVSSKGIYFVTSGLFQSWYLKKILKGQEIHEIGNIIRVISSRVRDEDDKIKSELTSITTESQENSPPIHLILHKVQGHDEALKTINFFSPDLVIVDEISEATTLKQNVLKSRREKINHIIPAADPGLRILSPQMITKGYDYKLFAQYVISRYLHNRGKPNETYIYYLNTDAEHMRKISMFLGGELSHVLNDNLQNIIEFLPECETKSQAQGSFTASLLETQFLKFKIDLHLTPKGFSKFLSKYQTLFTDHKDSLSTSVRLYLRAAQISESVHTKLHLIEGFNEFKIEEENISIDMRINNSRNMLTFKAKPHDGLEKRFKTLFTLLNGSDIFDALPDKELFIELVSLLWENYQASMYRTQGFTISLISNDDGSFQLEVFQSKQNKAILKGQVIDGERHIKFTGNTLHHPQSQRRLLKMMSLYFNSNKQDPKENTWRFACFEAMAQVVANGSQNQSLIFDFQMQGPRYSAIFLCDSTAVNVINERSNKMFHDGADIVDIGDNGRQVTLILNPTPEEQKGQLDVQDLQIELDGLQENAILEKVEDVKSKEAKERSEKLQKTYDEALKAYNSKYGGMEDDDSAVTGEIARPKTIEEATRANSRSALRRRTLPKGDLEKQRKKIRKYSFIAIATFLIPCILLVTVNFSGNDNKEKVSLRIKNMDQLSDEQIAKLYSKKPKVKPNKKIKKLPKDVAQKIIKNVCKDLYLANTPSPGMLNSLLKKLHFSIKKYPESGDIHNLMGRLYWYKIKLDQGDNFAVSWKKRWKREAGEHFDKAKILYSKNKVQPTILLYIMTWMPEKYFYKQGKKNAEYTKYKDNKSAIEDIKFLISKMR